MEHLSSAMEQQQNRVQWRRDKVRELCSKGYSQREISQVLQIGLATVNRDISYLRHQAKHNITKYINERLPQLEELYVRRRTMAVLELEITLVSSHMLSSIFPDAQSIISIITSIIDIFAIVVIAASFFYLYCH
jgi:hypothetical protein